MVILQLGISYWDQQRQSTRTHDVQNLIQCWASNAFLGDFQIWLFSAKSLNEERLCWLFLPITREHSPMTSLLHYMTFNKYSMSPRWIWSDKITNERVARVGYNHFISNKGEWNNCFSKFSNRVLPPIFISTILQSENFQTWRNNFHMT